MISNLKLGFKIMKYGHAAKLSIIGAIAMAVFGLVFCAISIMADVSFPGGYFLMFATLLLMQLSSTVNAANLVQTSPMKKKLQTSVPALLSTLMMLAAYLFNVVVAAVMTCANPEALEPFCTQMMITAVLMGVVMLYYGAVFKYFVASTMFFFIVIYPCLMSGMGGELLWGIVPFTGTWGNFVLAAVTGLAIILVCGAGQYLISLAVYKAPISKRALGARLRSQL